MMIRRNQQHNHRVFFRILALSLVLCAVHGYAVIPAIAEPQGVCEHRALPFSFDEEAMVACSFGEKSPNGLEHRIDPVLGEDKQSLVGFEYHYYYIPNQDGPPWCNVSRSPFFPGASEAGMRLRCPLGHDHSNYFSDDFEPSGIARGALTRDKAVQKADEALQAFSLGEKNVNAVLAYGAMGGDFAPTYSVRFRQTLDGLPLYWASANAIVYHNVQINLTANTAIVSICDGGVYNISANWSSFEPLAEKQPPVGEETAKAELARYGIMADEVELCYLLLPANGQENLATPAYRYQDKFVNALTGARMQ